MCTVRHAVPGRIHGGWALFWMGVILDGRYFGWALFWMGVILDGRYFGWALFGAFTVYLCQLFLVRICVFVSLLLKIVACYKVGASLHFNLAGSIDPGSNIPMHSSSSSPAGHQKTSLFTVHWMDNKNLCLQFAAKVYH